MPSEEPVSLSNGAWFIDDDDHCKTYGFTGSIVPATGPRESRLFRCNCSNSRESAALASNIAVVIRSCIAWPAESSRTRCLQSLAGHDTNLQSQIRARCPACLLLDP